MAALLGLLAGCGGSVGSADMLLAGAQAPQAAASSFGPSRTAEPVALVRRFVPSMLTPPEMLGGPDGVNHAMKTVGRFLTPKARARLAAAPHGQATVVRDLVLTPYVPPRGALPDSVRPGESAPTFSVGLRGWVVRELSPGRVRIDVQIDVVGTFLVAGEPQTWLSTRASTFTLVEQPVFTGGERWLIEDWKAAPQPIRRLNSGSPTR